MKTKVGLICAIVVSLLAYSWTRLQATAPANADLRSLPDFEDMKWKATGFLDPTSQVRQFGGSGIKRFVQWYFDSGTKTLTTTIQEEHGAAQVVSFSYRKDANSVTIDWPDGSLYLQAGLDYDPESEILTVSRIAPPAASLTLPAENFGTIVDAGGTAVGPATFPASTVHEPVAIYFSR